MTATRQDIPRTVIPRWRSWRTAERHGELKPTEASSWPSSEEEHEVIVARRARDFQRNPGAYTAADLLATSLVLGVRTTDVLSAAATRILDDRPHSLLAALAQSVLEDQEMNLERQQVSVLDVSNTRRRIGQLKRIVTAEPLNAVRWADLSRAYAVLGQTEQAARAMSLALNVGQPNRFILRAAARFEIYRNDFDRGHHILASRPERLSDPWLAAAELATADLAGRRSQNVRRARRLLESGSFSPWHASELASALAKLEFSSGHDRRARQLMRLALVDPTENSVAQAEWSSRFGQEIANERTLQLPLGFEARALHAHRLGEWDEAVNQGMSWLEDQPFAEDPACFTSYVASVNAEDYLSAERAARIGLTANPTSEMIANNLAFALANLDRPEQAREIVGRIVSRELDARSRAVLLATTGLIQFRSGQATNGRESYGKAVGALRALGLHVEGALATIFWAREELRLKSFQASDVLQQARQAAKGIASSEVRQSFDRLEQLASQGKGFRLRTFRRE